MLRAGPVHLTVDERIAVVTLDRPERRNAVDHPTLLVLLEIQAELADQIAAAGHGVRAVVVTGRPPAFSAGADLTGVEQGEFVADLGRVLTGFTQLSTPVIAAVDGPALGAGCQLALAADLRIATPGSLFGIPAARLGLALDHWTIRRASNELTPSVARGMLIAAETYSAERLHTLGGVHRLGSLDDALSWAHDLAALAPLTMAAHKLGLERLDQELDVDEPYEAARRAAWSSADAEEGRVAFLEKRRARFTGE